MDPTQSGSNGKEETLIVIRNMKEGQSLYLH